LPCHCSPPGCQRHTSSRTTSMGVDHCRGGSYQILDSESHAGGLLADIIPGPVTWYTMSYACGPSNGRLADFPFRGPHYKPPSIQTCSQFGNTVTCVGN